jgi:acyl-CoA reductase-like NAD-dependent aldehyde dehydrogenase
MRIGDTGRPLAWAELDERLRWMAAFRALVARHADELSGLISTETHKPVWQALTGDVMPLVAACAWHERHVPGLLSSRRATRGPLWLLGNRTRIERVPLGRVAIIATWNYPIQLLGVQLLQALAAGNRVVVKPSEHTPRSQLRLLELAVAAGLPDGVLTAAPATREAGAALLEGRYAGPIDHVLFTGSTTVGREIASWAASRLVPTTLELSGRDSAIVLADADATLAARSIWNAVVMNAGQTCMAPRRALVDRSIYRRFTAALAPLAAGARPVRLISEGAARRTWELASAAVTAGGHSLSGVLEPPRGASMVPVAVGECPPECALTDGDHFGPALAVVPVDGWDGAMAVHRRCDQRLATSVFTRSVREARRLAPQLGSVYVTINDAVVPAMHPGTGVGGLGASGWGISRGPEGLLAMTRPLYVASTSPRLRLPTGEVSGAALRGLRRMVRLLYARGPRPRVEPTPCTTPSVADPAGVDARRTAAPTGLHATENTRTPTHAPHERRPMPVAESR